jgi:CRISPR-associated protein (TIGR03984 family)
MTLKIERRPAVCKTDMATAAASIDVKKWLEDQIPDEQQQKTWWLLAHTEQGVVWGRADKGVLITAHEAAKKSAEAQRYCPPLRADLLQQARLFCDTAEVLLWRNGDGQWQARLISDAKSDGATWIDAMDEPQFLVGTDSTALDDGFRLWEDGAQGLRHALPKDDDIQYKFDKDDPKEKVKHRPPYLKVRHYVLEDATGVARIVASRLMGFEEVGK